MMNEATPRANFPSTQRSRMARVGDPAAPAELGAAYWSPIYVLMRRKGHSPDRALDLTQAAPGRRPLTADPDAARFAQLAAELKTSEGAMRTASNCS